MAGSTQIDSPPKPRRGRARLSIAGELTIYRAAELKLQLVEQLERHSALDLDLAQVSEIDCAGLQLLLFAQRATQARNGELRFIAPSPVVLEVFALLQLAPPAIAPPEAA